MLCLKRGLTLIPLIWLAAFLAGCGGGSSGSQLPGDFTLSLSPNNVKMDESSQATVTVTINPQNGFSGSVIPSITGLPTGVTAAFSPNPASTTTTLTLTASPSASTGKATVTITGVSGSIASTTTFFLTVSQGSGGAQTFTALSSTPNPSVYGQPVTFTATVTSQGSPLPSSTNGELVAFKQKSIVLGEGTLSSGIATFTTSTLTAGFTYSITAEYDGDANFSGSTSNPVSQVVNLDPTTTTLVSLENPANVGQPVTFVATVTSQTGIQVTGSVGFYEGTSKVGNTPLSNGVASLAITNSEASGASETITAEYDGSSETFAPSTSAPVTEVWATGSVVDVCGSPQIDDGCPTNYQWNGVYRAFEVFVPTALPANPAIVIMLHGTQIDGGSDPSNPLPIIQLMWGWQDVANYYGFILVKPASTYDASSNQWSWNSYCMDGTSLCEPYGSEGGAFPYAENCGSADGECPDDSGFLRSLIGSLLSNQNNGFPYGNFTANPSMVYVTGFSSGAQMTERVGVELSDLVAAISPASGPLYNVQGTIQPPLPLPGNAVAPPVPVQEWHGTSDEELPPCDGAAAAGTNGTTDYSGVIFTLDTVDDTFNYWTGPQVNNFTDQNAAFQIPPTDPPSPILCTTVSGTNLTGSNYLNDASTPPYPEPPNIPVMPNTLTGNIAVSTLPPSGSWPSPVAITAASESGTTVTVTSTLNPGVGGVAIITGMTPSQYNGNWVVTESTSTGFQYTNTASGLAAATGFGTAQGGQTTEVQFIWEPDIAHSYQEQYDWARWLFFAYHPKP